MNAVYELKSLRNKVKARKAQCEKDIDRFIKAETRFRKYTTSITALFAQIQMLDEMDEWLKAELRKAVLMAEAEL